MSDSTVVQALRRAFQVAPTLRKGLIVTLLLAGIGTAMSLVVPITLQRIVDGQLVGVDTIDTGAVLRSGLVAVGAVVLAAIARWTSLMRIARFVPAGLAELRNEAFSHLHRLSALHTETNRRGAMVARVTSDVAALEHFMEWAGIGMLIGITQLVLAMTTMLFYSARLALIVIAGVAVYGTLLLWFQRLLKRAHGAHRNTISDSMSAVSESITGLPIIRAHGAEAETLSRVDQALGRQFVAGFRTARFGAFLFSSAEIFAGLITAAVIGFGVIFGARGQLTTGTLLAFLFLVNLLTEPVQMIVEASDSAQAAGAGLRKVLTVIDEPVDLPDSPDPQPLPVGSLAVAAIDTTFQYPTGPPIIRNLHLSIGPGERVAVVGQTGSGKTTFAKLVARLIDPTAGAILVGGVDARDVSFSDLRSRVSYVPQQGFLFNTSIIENIRYGRAAATDQEVKAAITDLNLGDWVEGLPHGLSTMAGLRGQNLSAGERQLVALTRAWVANPDLLILDEATSAVDPALELRLRDAIERLAQGRTSITVAHRLSTAEAADRVLVFDSGEIVEDGTHAKLVELGGVYASLHADWAIATR